MKGRHSCPECAGRGYIERDGELVTCDVGERKSGLIHNTYLRRKRRGKPRRRAEGKRTDRSLLDYIKTLPCLVCGKTPSDPDHITTRGAGGDDRATNVWPLCRDHHNERNQPNKGLVFMVNAYPVLRTWLRLAGRHDILERAGVPLEHED